MMESVYVNYAMTEQGDSSSAEDVESPRSVMRRRCSNGRWRKSRHQTTSNNNSNSNSNLNANNDNNNNNSNKGEKCYLHSQVLRVKEEELQIEEALMGDFGIFNVVYVVDSQPLDDVSSSKIMLPASPLGSMKKKNDY